MPAYLWKRLTSKSITISIQAMRVAGALGFKKRLCLCMCRKIGAIFISFAS